MWKKIYKGAYKINKSGTVVRVKEAKGTSPGKILQHWFTYPDALPKVSLSFEGIRKDFFVDDLIARTFR